MATFRPNTKHPSLIEYEDQYDLVSALWAGTTAMRNEGTRYLPKEPAETTENYQRRLSKSVLYPAYRTAITATTGKLFAGDLVVENFSPLLNPILDNIDEDGNDLEVFAQEVTSNSLHYGCSYILVDYPVLNDNATLADEMAAGAQPYWVMIEAPQILEASPLKEGGKNKLEVFRFKEREAYRDGEFSVSYRDRVKEFKLIDGVVHFRVFIEQDNDWSLHAEGTLPFLSGIPVSPVYSNRTGYFLGSPYFYELAEENLLNYQLRSDYNNVVHMVTIPMLAISGASGSYDDSGVKQEITISPNTVLEFSNPDTKAEWIEVSGSASGVGRQAVEDSYRLMSELSLEAINDLVSGKTATEVMVSSGESNAAFRVLEDQIENALTNAIDFTYQYLMIPNPGTKIDLIIAEETLPVNEPTTETEITEEDK